MQRNDLKQKTFQRKKRCATARRMSGIDPGPSRPSQVERGDVVWRHISLILSVFFRFYSSRAFPLCSCNTSTPPLHHPRSPSTRKFSESSVILFRNVRSFRLHRRIRFNLIATTHIAFSYDGCANATRQVRSARCYESYVESRTKR